MWVTSRSETNSPDIERGRRGQRAERSSCVNELLAGTCMPFVRSHCLVEEEVHAHGVLYQLCTTLTLKHVRFFFIVVLLPGPLTLATFQSEDAIHRTPFHTDWVSSREASWGQLQLRHLQPAGCSELFRSLQGWVLPLGQATSVFISSA